MYFNRRCYCLDADFGLERNHVTRIGHVTLRRAIIRQLALLNYWKNNATKSI